MFFFSIFMLLFNIIRKLMNVSSQVCIFETSQFLKFRLFVFNFFEIIPNRSKEQNGLNLLALWIFRKAKRN